MRRFLAVLLLAAPLGGCALQPPSTTAASVRNVPLQARIVPDIGGRNGGIAFTLNRPAHVALFEIIPGQGVGLMYPRFGSERDVLASGFHRPLFGFGDFRWAYQQTPVYRSWSVPRYYYLVASEWPLNTDRFASGPTAMRAELGLNRFASYNPYSLVDHLDQLIAPDVQGEWTSDLYVVWPEPPGGDPANRHVAVRCPDGRTVLVPLHYIVLACPNADRNQTAPAQRGEEEEAEEENGNVERPTRKRPEVPRPRTAPEADSEVRPAQPAVERAEPTRPERPAGRGEDRPSPRVEPAGDPRPSPRTEPRTEPGTEPRTERAEPRPPSPQLEPRVVPRAREADPA